MVKCYGHFCIQCNIQTSTTKLRFELLTYVDRYFIPKSLLYREQYERKSQTVLPNLIMVNGHEIHVQNFVLYNCHISLNVYE